MPPDLADPEKRAAYRRELRGIARRPRRAGFALVLAGAALLVWPRMGGPWYLGDWRVQDMGWALLAAGWIVWLYVIIIRTRHHQRRMRGG